MREWLMHQILRSAADGLFIPGAGDGFEILVLYCRQWRRQCALMCAGLITLTCDVMITLIRRLCA